MKIGKISFSLDSYHIRYKALFSVLDLSKDFFFSYTYDLTHTLQNNMKAAQQHLSTHASNSFIQKKGFNYSSCNKMFVWNRFLVSPLVAIGKDDPENADLANLWIQPLVHGYFAQNSTTVC